MKATYPIQKYSLTTCWLKKIFFSSLFSLVFIACNSNSQNKTDSTKLVLATENSQEQNIKENNLPFIEDNFSKAIFPLKIDTVFFEEKQKLPTDFLIKLEQQIKGDEKRYALQFPSFIKLNKLKKGQDPVESGDFDIGESIEVTHYDMGYSFLEEQKIWLAFIGVKYEPFPACPWGSGREIVLCTFDIGGSLIDLVTIAENSEGGDPPSWGRTEKKVFSENGNIYTLSSTNTFGEDNDMGEVDFQEIEKQTQKITIQPNGKLKIEELKKK